MNVKREYIASVTRELADAWQSIQDAQIFEVKCVEDPGDDFSQPGRVLLATVPAPHNRVVNTYFVDQKVHRVEYWEATLRWRTRCMRRPKEDFYQDGLGIWVRPATH